MTFQSTVFVNQGAGVPGEKYTDAPWMAQSFTVVSPSAANNIFGSAFSKTAEGFAACGAPSGNLGFAGFLVNPKGSALFGTNSGGALAPSLTLANNAQGEFLTMGSIWVLLPAAAAIGDVVLFDNTTGALTTQAPGGTLPGGKSYANAFVDFFTVAAAGLAVITVLNTQTPFSA